MSLREMAEELSSFALSRSGEGGAPRGQRSSSARSDYSSSTAISSINSRGISGQDQGAAAHVRWYRLLAKGYRLSVCRCRSSIEPLKLMDTRSREYVILVFNTGRERQTSRVKVQEDVPSCHAQLWHA